MKLFFSVGEPSGDQHAAQLIKELRLIDSAVTCCGYGGPEMREQGCDLHFQLTDLAVMGFLKVIPLLKQFRDLVKRAERIFQQDRPDAVILVDFPGFNWHIAKRAKRMGIPVFYYLPPQLWAWAAWRIKKLKKHVDYVISGLSFEEKWYESRGVDIEYVGHPFFDEVRERKLDHTFISNLSGSSNHALSRNQIVGILPGSRKQEVINNFPLQLKLARRLQKKIPHLTFPVACYKPAHLELCSKILARESTSLPVELHCGKTSEIIGSCGLLHDGFGFCQSGTSREGNSGGCDVPVQ